MSHASRQPPERRRTLPPFPPAPRRAESVAPPRLVLRFALYTAVGLALAAAGILLFVRQHGIAHYLDLVRDGRVDLGGMLTHTFPLERWRDAFTTLIDQGETGAIKVAFDLRA